GVFLDLAGRSWHEQMVDPCDVDDFHRPGLLASAGELTKLFRMMWRNLHIEIALDDQDWLLDLTQHGSRIGQQEAAEPRRVRLIPNFLGKSVPSGAADHRRLDLLLERDLLRLLSVGQLHPIELTLLLFENELGAGRTAGRDQYERADLVFAVGSEHGDHPALAMAHDGDPPRVDVVSLRQPFDDANEIFG